MDWSKGYSANYYMTYVDPKTWADTSRIEIHEGSINRTTDGLRESASVACNQDFLDIETWVRIYMNTDQNGDRSHEPVFTGLATSPSLEFNGNIKNNNYECYSVLKPADDIILSRGWYASAGSSGAEVVKDLLKSTPAPASIPEEYSSDKSQYLENYIIAEDGDSNLSMIDSILLAINWRLRVKGDGSITIEPVATEPSYRFDPLDFDIIEPSVKISSDWFSAPNVFCAISDGLTAVARDEDDDSPLSIQNRGREVWLTESNCDLSTGESIEAYANRRLAEEQRIVKTASYSRRYVPDVIPGDLITLHYPKQNMDGLFYISSQSIDLGYSAKTSEEVMSYAG